jgi:hypothetical protein
MPIGPSPNVLRYSGMIQKAAKMKGVSPSLLAALVHAESGGSPTAGSPVGARGLTQLMPGTARSLGVKNINDPWQNLLGGATYLSQQMTRFDDPRLALSAYNSGPGGAEAGGHVEAIAETQAYVARVMELEKQYRDMTGMATPPTAGAATRTAQARGGAKAGAAISNIWANLTPGTPLPELNRDRMYGQQGEPGAEQRPNMPSLAQMGVQQASGVGGTGADAELDPAEMAKNAGNGITYSGQPTTHETAGLAGYPAVDLFGEPGTPFVAPENGHVVRLSGKGGTSGQVFGFSVYFKGDSGKEYFITHLGPDRPAVGSRLAKGDPLGSISPWDGGSPHAHVGVKKAAKK